MNSPERQLAEAEAKIRAYRREIARMAQIIAEQADFIGAASTSRAATCRELIRHIESNAQPLVGEESGL